MNWPLGFQYAAFHAGIRKDQRDDVALIVTTGKPAAAAAVFTTNVVQAAPVQIARQHLVRSGGRVKALLVNAGNANCATRTGTAVAIASAEAVAAALKTKPHLVLPASTGVIGVELDAALLTGAVPKLVAQLAADSFREAAEAILTTDTRVKLAGEELELRGGTVRVAGFTKGSGMIHPNMATTLGFVMTDALLPASLLQGMLQHGIRTSFNALTVDGDMSTNDMVTLLASGASKVKPRGGRERKMIAEAVQRVLESLAKQIAADGEGARKLVTVTVEGFRSDEEARRVARAIANSPLVKTAIAGSDPNWGRILAAAGYSGVPFNPKHVSIALQDVEVCRRGLATEMDEAAMRKRLDENEVRIRLALSRGGKGRATFFTCDLTEGYIRINGSYRT